MGAEQVLAVVLAGGRGARLEPLTRERAKPAVPFGGGYRIIDFTLSNCLNSGLKRILVLTQYKAMSLDHHVLEGWSRFFCRELGEFLDILPPQQRVDDKWYRGTADAVYQNIYSLERVPSEFVLVLSGDHIYKMDYRRMIRFHQESGAEATIAAIPVNVSTARELGVLSVDATHRVVAFEEKPDVPSPLPNDSNMCLASMGIYVFSTRFLFEVLIADANCPDSEHDFGKDILPRLVSERRVFAYPFEDENRKASAYWRDVGTLDAYYHASMDLVAVDPELNLYDRQWPIRSRPIQAPPPKFVFGSGDSLGPTGRAGLALDSLVCAGCILSGGRVARSLLGPHVKVHSHAVVEDSILFEGVEVGRNARIRRAILDKAVRVPEGAQIGLDREADLARGFTVTPQGVTVIGKADRIPVPAEPPPTGAGSGHPSEGSGL